MSKSHIHTTSPTSPSTAMNPKEASSHVENIENSKKRKLDKEELTEQRLKKLDYATVTEDQQKIIDKQEKDLLDSNKHYNRKEEEEKGMFYGRGAKNSRPVKSFLDEDYMRTMEVDGKKLLWDGWDKKKKFEYLKKEGALAAASGMNKLLHNVLKGVSSDTNHLDSGRITNWKRSVEDLVKTQKHLSGASKKYPEILKGFVNSLGPKDFDELGTLAPDSMMKLMNSIEQQIKVEEKHDDEEAKKLKEIVDKMSGAYSDVVQKYTKESDDMFKYRVLQMVLLFTPLSPVSLITPLLNAMLPFLNGAGFASFIASFLSVDGPLGYLAWLTDKMELDVAAQWLMEVPFGFVSDTVDVFADALSPLLLSGLPVLNGPLFALAVGASYSVYSRLLPEYEHFTKYAEERDKTKKSLKDQVIKNYSEFAAKRDVRKREYTEKFVQEMQSFYTQETLLDDLLYFVSGHSEQEKYEMLEASFFNIKMPKPKEEMNFVDFIKTNREICSDREKLKEFLLKAENKELYKAAIDRFTLADEISKKKPLTAEDISKGNILPASEMKLQIEELLKDPEKVKIATTNNHKKRGYDALVEFAPECGIEIVDYHLANSEHLKKEIIQRIENTLKYAPENPENYKPPKTTARNPQRNPAVQTPAIEVH